MATVYKNIPCGNPADCPASCATTSIAVQPPCPTTVKPPPTTVKPPPTTVTKVCTKTETQKVYGTACAIKCPKEPICIADAAVTVPCGCDRVTIAVKTETVCATATPCPVICMTGWGFFTVTESKCNTVAPPTSVPTVTIY